MVQAKNNEQMQPDELRQYKTLQNMHFIYEIQIPIGDTRSRIVFTLSINLQTLYFSIYFVFLFFFTFAALQCFSHSNLPFHLKCMILQSIHCSLRVWLRVCEKEWVLVGHFWMHYLSAWRRMKQANAEVKKRRGDVKGIKCRRWKF